MTPGLDRLLWQYDYGRAGRYSVERELRGELRRMSDARSATDAHRGIVDARRPGVLASRDVALHETHLHLDAANFRAALRRLRACEALTAEAEAIVAAAGAIDAASREVQAIEARLATETLRKLPAVASLAQLVGVARARTAAGHHGEAVAIARTCVRLAAPLLVRRSLSRDEELDLERRITALVALCDETRPFAPPADADPARDASLAALRSIAAETAPLALRLLTEIEIRLQPRSRFLLHWRQKIAAGAATQTAADALRALVVERSWDGAVDYEWRVAVATHTKRLTEAASRAASASANLDQMLA